MRKYVLDLSEIYSDHRQKAYLGHRASWTTIHTLIQTVRDIFGIKSHVHVCSAEQIFYPDSESVDILRDGETLKILLDSATVSNETIETKLVPDTEIDILKASDTNNPPQDSTVEYIECDLQRKRKRRRGRKRKIKRESLDESTELSASKETMEEATGKDQENSSGFPDTERKVKSGAENLSSAKVDERPYRNLNRQMQARVVRAVSLSTLSTPPPTDEMLITSPSELNGPADDESINGIQSEESERSGKIARVVRALSLENTAEVKRELIEVIMPLEMARKITAQMGQEHILDHIHDEHDVSLANDDMETYSTIVSDV